MGALLQLLRLGLPLPLPRRQLPSSHRLSYRASTTAALQFRRLCLPESGHQLPTEPPDPPKPTEPCPPPSQCTHTTGSFQSPFLREWEPEPVSALPWPSTASQNPMLALPVRHIQTYPMRRLLLHSPLLLLLRLPKFCHQQGLPLPQVPWRLPAWLRCWDWECQAVLGPQASGLPRSVCPVVFLTNPNPCSAIAPLAAISHRRHAMPPILLGAIKPRLTGARPPLRP